MIKLNKEQSKWMKKNFCLSKKDFPSDFYEPNDFLEIICGTHYFRGKDYLGDSMSFIEDCLMSLFARTENKEKFQLLFKQMHNYWIVMAKENEFYELLHNLNVLNENFIDFVRQANEAELDLEIRSMLNDLNINIE